jgi:hypothetical protein
VTEWTIIDGEILRGKLDELVSPRLSGSGLTWRADGAWVEPGACAIRRVVHFHQLKGLRAVISWGYSLNFVPLPSGTRLRYHRTFKTARADVFEWPVSYAESFSGSTDFESISLLARQFDGSLRSYFDAQLPLLTSWFRRIRGLSAIEEELRRQIASPSAAYRVHHPAPAYVLPFVVAAQGRASEAEQLAAGCFALTAPGLLCELQTALQRSGGAFKEVVT